MHDALRQRQGPADESPPAKPLQAAPPDINASAKGAIRSWTARILPIIRGLFVRRVPRLGENPGFQRPAFDAPAGLEQPPAEKHTLQRIVAELDRLPVRCREIFLLHQLGLSYPLIARRLEINVATVEKNIAEAMMRLEEAITADRDRA